MTFDVRVVVYGVLVSTSIAAVAINGKNSMLS